MKSTIAHPPTTDQGATQASAARILRVQLARITDAPDMPTNWSPVLDLVLALGCAVAQALAGEQ